MIIRLKCATSLIPFVDPVGRDVVRMDLLDQPFEDAAFQTYLDIGVTIGVRGLGPDDQVGARVLGDGVADERQELGQAVLIRSILVGVEPDDLARLEHGDPGAVAEPGRRDPERAIGQRPDDAQDHNRRSDLHRQGQTNPNRPAGFSPEQGEGHEVDPEDVDGGDQETQTQCTGKVGNLGEIDQAILAVGQVIPGESGQDEGSDVFQSDPEDRRRDDQGQAEPSPGEPCEEEERRPPRRQEPSHDEPAEPGRLVGHQNPVQRQEPENEPTGERTQVNHPLRPPTLDQQEQRGQRDPGRARPFGRRKREPEQQARGQAEPGRMRQGPVRQRTRAVRLRLVARQGLGRHWGSFCHDSNQILRRSPTIRILDFRSIRLRIAGTRRSQLGELNRQDAKFAKDRERNTKSRIWGDSIAEQCALAVQFSEPFRTSLSPSRYSRNSVGVEPGFRQDGPTGQRSGRNGIASPSWNARSPPGKAANPSARATARRSAEPAQPIGKIRPSTSRAG